MKNLYAVEVTDTFGGEANYCWVRRYTIKSVSMLGAVQKLSRHEGLSFRKSYGGRYDAKGACVCAFIDYADEYSHDGKHL
jgi:hypothetical protein